MYFGQLETELKYILFNQYNYSKALSGFKLSMFVIYDINKVLQINQILLNLTYRQLVITELNIMVILT